MGKFTILAYSGIIRDLLTDDAPRFHSFPNWPRYPRYIHRNTRQPSSRSFDANRNMSKALGTYREDPRRGAELQEVLGELQQCQNSWKSEFVEAQYKGQPSAGIDFAHKESLNTLRDRGCLEACSYGFDSQNCPSLFTVFVRDEVGSVILPYAKARRRDH